MKEIDDEFGPIRKSVHKVNANEIIEDVRIDGQLKKIPLQRGIKRPIDHINSKKEDETIKRKSVEKEDSSSQNSGGPSDSDKQLFKSLQRYLIRKLNGNLSFKDSKVPGFLKDTAFQLERLLRQCIIQKESHSAIIIGPRSGYKSLLIKRELESLRATHEEQFIVINLNGYLNSENSAISSIAEQLEYELSRRSNNTMQGQKTKDLGISDGTPTEVFENILKLLDSFTVTPLKGVHSQKEKSEHVTLVFVFDEIDQFAGPVRQTLLYNLFDLVETSRIPVCVLGLTTKISIMQFLENRVKSRFSQRIINMPFISNFDQFVQTFEELLEIDDAELKNQFSWNTYLKSLLRNEKSEIFRVLKTNYDNFKDTEVIRNALIPSIALSKSYEELTQEIETCIKMKKYLANQLSDTVASKLRSLSELELGILISACRVAVKNDEFINLTLVHEEFTKLGKSHKTTFADKFKLWTKQDMKNVWENLAVLELITERGAISVKFTEDSAIQSANYNSSTMRAPFDLRTYQVYVTLQELRRIVPKNSLFYPWTQL
ncbi:origin recognition complex subunit 4 [Kluyveromyces marxianus]|uniref:Origin recognition complex subunit 4 n=2 Tax=Kluyveromyces marxianus TaxID=4911 RepID=W0TEN8_KLUMD|nr:origin recognition complex subunit 4 [Kluyveromyces marxianus DMKU3-1042]QGN18246.1 origin recognition complex subunit 4 [Kluyveromyces marxianus]BAO42112.1 origin recognition complex subunit 4 [Kluyveromyces marxianus DMKU3-1042]BAP73524.1 origin recognition complex subunit 4 [Kluyveromyces marxianus]